MSCIACVKEEGRELEFTRIADPRDPERINKRVSETTKANTAADPMCVGCFYDHSGGAGCDIGEAADVLYSQAREG